MGLEAWDLVTGGAPSTERQENFYDTVPSESSYSRSFRHDSKPCGKSATQNRARV